MLFPDSLYLLPDERYRALFLVNVDARDHWQLGQAIGSVVLHSAGVKIMAIAYQLESISSPIFPGVIENVSVGQPRTDDGKRE